MKRQATILTILLSFFFFPFSHPVKAEDPVLARLSFRVPPKQRAAFEAAYATEIVPLLKQHGLVPSLERGRTTPNHFFSRLFIFEHPAAILKIRRALRLDPHFNRTLKGLGVGMFRERFGSIPYPFVFEPYSVPAKFARTMPAGPGKIRTAGPGKGSWRTYSEADGLAGVSVYGLLQDQKGNLWFGTTTRGISRFDGSNWKTFTIEDGLAGFQVPAVFEDSKGHLWFATTSRGVSRYKPLTDTWTTFNAKNGLVDNRVRAIAEDRAGHLWVGTLNGTSRYAPSTGTWTTFNTKDGLPPVHAILEDRTGYLWFGTIGGVSRYNPKSNTWTTFNTEDGLPDNRVWTVHEDHAGHLWFGTPRGASRYDPKSNIWTTFNTEDGLPDNRVLEITKDSKGYLWFGTVGGASRYDPEHNTWTSFDTEDGLVNNRVRGITEDSAGHLWFGTFGGVSRYDGSDWTTLDTTDGLTHNAVYEIAEDHAGHLWFGFEQEGGGVTRYDGSTLTTFTTQNGLVHDNVKLIYKSNTSHHLWFGTRGGISRYDGSTFMSFTQTTDGLGGSGIDAIAEDHQGHLWVGFGPPGGGVSRYDGSNWTTFSTVDGLASNGVASIAEDRNGILWIKTTRGINCYDGQTFSTVSLPEQVPGWDSPVGVFNITRDHEGTLWFVGSGGVCRYDGQTWTLVTKREYLGSRTRSISIDTSGHLWFATSAGVSRYNGQVFQTLISHDGLADDLVFKVFQDRKGDFWFGTQRGLTRYRLPPETTPSIYIDAVIAGQRYTTPRTVEFSSNVPLISFEFHGTNLKTRPEAMVYRYRLLGYEEEWRTTRDRRVEYEALNTGSYTFEIQAIDRDLTYSRLATVALQVIPPFYLQNRFTIPIGIVGSLIIGVIIFQTTALVRRRREVTRYQQAAVAELGDAREVQLSLLPKSAPQIQGFDIAGICEPAAEVGGDYFTYCQLNGTSENLGIVLMDVTGHGMRAATTTFLANGMLQSEILSQHAPNEVLTQMDRSLKRVLSKRSFVAVAFAHLNFKNRTLTHYNAGFPEPILWRNGQSIPLNVHNTRPLGGPLKPQFAGTNVALQSGDMILMFSDGLTEAANEEGALYGEGRLSDHLSSLSSTGKSSQGWITAIQQDVQDFVGNGELEDDLTIVGMRVL